MSRNTRDVRQQSDNEEFAPFSIALNIEGKTFQTSEDTVTSIPGSLLSELNTDSKFYNKTSNAYCFDRDSNLFPHILSAHRYGEVHVPQDVCAIRFSQELEFWKIPQSLIAPCCWKYYYSACEDVGILTKIIQSFYIDSGSHRIRQVFKLGGVAGVDGNRSPEEEQARTSSWKHRLWLFLDEPRSSRAAMIWCYIFVAMATLSVIMNLIWLEKSMRVEPYLTPYRYEEKKLELEAKGNYNATPAKIDRLVLTDPHIVLLTLDCICTVFFALELFAHFTVCPNKRRYFFDWYYVVKVMLSFIMVYSTVFEMRKDWLFDDRVAKSWFWIKNTNTLRVLLIFKLYKISGTLNTVFLAFLNCMKEMTLLLMVCFLMVIMYGGLIFAFEMDSDMFPDTARSCWWALITMTTIGYGDFHPTRPMGYLVGMVCAVDGVILIALPIAVIASQFSKYRDRNDDLQKHMEVVKQEEAEAEKRRKGMDKSGKGKQNSGKGMDKSGKGEANNGKGEANNAKRKENSEKDKNKSEMVDSESEITENMNLSVDCQG